MPIQYNLSKITYRDRILFPQYSQSLIGNKVVDNILCGNHSSDFLAIFPRDANYVGQRNEQFAHEPFHRNKIITNQHPEPVDHGIGECDKRNERNEICRDASNQRQRSHGTIRRSIQRRTIRSDMIDGGEQSAIKKDFDVVYLGEWLTIFPCWLTLMWSSWFQSLDRWVSRMPTWLAQPSHSLWSNALGQHQN